MVSKKLLIEVELVPVMISIIAEPGDKLMMLNGICIGVDTSRETVTPVPMPRRALSVDKALPVKPSKASPLKGIPAGYKADSFSEQCRNAVIANASDGKVHTSKELCDGMTKPVKAVIYHAITTLIRDGKIKKAGNGRYVTTAKPAKADKSPTYHDNRLMLYREMKAIGITQARSDLDRMISAGEFPRSLKVGTTRKWRRSEIEQWLLNQKAA